MVFAPFLGATTDFLQHIRYDFQSSFREKTMNQKEKKIGVKTWVNWKNTSVYTDETAEDGGI